MGLVPINKIKRTNQSLDVWLKGLLNNVDTRRYWSSNNNNASYNYTYRIPISGYYSIMAYNAVNGSLGRVNGLFEKGEYLYINSPYRRWSISLAGTDTNIFSMGVSYGVSINALTNKFNSALAIGEGGTSYDGGSATVRCDSYGIAVGGGGGFYKTSSYSDERQYNGSNGGAAYIYGNGIALGGGGGAHYDGGRVGVGGTAYVNGVAVSARYNSYNYSVSMSGNNSFYNNGGNGGCGGRCLSGGYSYGRYSAGSKSRGGSGVYNYTYIHSEQNYETGKYTNTTVYEIGGYFAGLFNANWVNSGVRHKPIIHDYPNPNLSLTTWSVCIIEFLGF